VERWSNIVTRPFAVFDIDGTILRWQLYHAIGDEMAKHGLIDEAEFSLVMKARMNWKKRRGEDSFSDYEHKLVRVFDNSLKGVDVKDFKEITGYVFDKYKDQVYTYTRNLIIDLKNKDYLLFAISGSPEMIVKLFSQYYGFDDCAGSIYEIKNDKFTGKKELSIGKKAEILKSMVKSYDSTYKDSIAVGDSEGDIAMLKLVATPIAFNPSHNLLNEAKKNDNWQVVIERKNVIYELKREKGHGKYVLS
jgi:HAD superfamily hydrolase (TIGR01490 family)